MCVESVSACVCVRACVGVCVCTWALVYVCVLATVCVSAQVRPFSCEHALRHECLHASAHAHSRLCVFALVRVRVRVRVRVGGYRDDDAMQHLVQRQRHHR